MSEKQNPLPCLVCGKAPEVTTIHIPWRGGLALVYTAICAEDNYDDYKPDSGKDYPGLDHQVMTFGRTEEEAVANWNSVIETALLTRRT